MPISNIVRIESAATCVDVIFGLTFIFLTTWPLSLLVSLRGPFRVIYILFAFKLGFKWSEWYNGYDPLFFDL